ncbi:PiuC Uncharacterized iron-regulated protein [uncultured Caudovirales phage]|uniref:PiuC Uncharacterized iron-regulated protein n=1 Tax=uncultured Caudovirales phage TaxID=2100421 RepID=A0A6J5Q8C1_9CAUD|nr:PiuC Uncharacterized iron-regulated protein [uncultured Caudovirales phage]
MVQLREQADRANFHFFDLNTTKYARDTAWWDGGFNFDDVQRIKALGMEFEERPGETMGAQGDTEHVRRCTVRWFENNEKTAWVYARFAEIARKLNAEFFGFDLTGFETFQFTTYDAERNKQTEYYDWHIDMRSGDHARMQRKLSLVLQLTDPQEYEGGELWVHNVGKAVVAKVNGRVFAFPSYALHRVTPVTAGVRHTLVAWAYGPDFR